VTQSLEVLSTLFSLAQLSSAHIRACSEIAVADVEALVRYAYRECKHSTQGSVVLGDIVRRAEQSGVSLSQWISEIVAVYRWLEVRQMRAPLREIIEYVSCAQEGSDLQVGHSIEWYLEHYGFESAQQCPDLKRT
jgi:hypothetical protein